MVLGKLDIHTQDNKIRHLLYMENNAKCIKDLKIWNHKTPMRTVQENIPWHGLHNDFFGFDTKNTHQKQK